ncbi:MAG: GNAT family N-acetyltransferase, partial [Chloroflexota bacterium]|nr:GNAT family N-acetyltransferase [Chloroflexota bacterium]
AAKAGLVATGELESGEQVWRRTHAGSADRTQVTLQRLPTADLTAADVSAIRQVLGAAFGPQPQEAFTEDDWQHALGGMHFLLRAGAEIVSHASVVERELHVAGRPLRTGYVEAVATAPRRQGAGHGSRIMRDIAAYIRQQFELGALGTGSQGFYERLGWLRWQGPTYVRTAVGPQRTPEEDGYVLVLPTPSSPPLDLTAPISCEWRPGDVW